MLGADKSQAVLRAVLESPEDLVIFALDREYRYLAFNANHARTMEAIWGAKLAVGDDMLAYITRTDDVTKARANFDRALSGESFTQIEEYGDEQMSRRFYHNTYSPIRAEGGEVIGLTVYLKDVTEQRAAELELSRYRDQLEHLVAQRTAELEAAHAQLLHAQKLESMGLLAGGIAHDFNNLLAVVLGRTELALGSLGEDHRGHAHLEVVRDTALEARMLTRQLLGYAGRGKFMVQCASLSELVESMTQLLRASVSKTIHLDFVMLSADAAVEVDVTQIRQVLLNLVTNAAEAIGDAPGRVTVRCYVREVTAHELARACTSNGLSPGSYACLEVEDTGSGMDERVRTKLFDPFFTTKFSGRGLGLAAVLGIVTGHHGTILLRTAPGLGSTFSVLFPIAKARAEALPRATASLDSVGKGTVLVVDDEESVRMVTAEVLRVSGYEVLTAESGQRAIAIFRELGARIDAVLLDLTMPDMTGEDTLRAIKAVREDARVVLMTGYTEDEVRLRFVRGELSGFLTKPFVRDELVRAVAAAVMMTDAGVLAG